MAERDEKGRFVKGSAAAFGRKGGAARFAKLSREEQAALGRSGYEAMLAKIAEERFGGDVEAALSWIGQQGGRKRQGKNERG